MSMTRKHFNGIASAVSEARDRLSRPSVSERYSKAQIKAMDFMVDVVADTLARELRLHNSNFDRERFLKACGVGDGHA